jgi:hypothetical protein
MKSCTLLTVRPKYCAAATHPLSLTLPCTLKSASSASVLSRSSSYNTAFNRSGTYSAAGASYGNDTEDNNTTNSNSDNDSDTKSASASRKGTRALGNTMGSSTDSEASSIPSLHPTGMSLSSQASMRLSALSVCADSLHGLENKIGGLGVYSINRNDNFPTALNGPKRDDPNNDHCSPGYHLTYQSHSFSGNSSEKSSAMSSPRDYDIPLPL